MNWYVYCSNNPLNRIDPTGLDDLTAMSPGDEIDPLYKDQWYYQLGASVTPEAQAEATAWLNSDERVKWMEDRKEGAMLAASLILTIVGADAVADVGEAVFNAVNGNWAGAGASLIGLFAPEAIEALIKMGKGPAKEFIQQLITRNADEAAELIEQTVKKADIVSDGTRNIDEVKSLYHYTDESGMNGIIDSKSLNPSLKANNPNDARYGNGQYMSDILPGQKTPAQLSREFIGNPFQGKKYNHFIEIDVAGLNVINGRPGVFVVPNEIPLDLSTRILGFGPLK